MLEAASRENYVRGRLLGRFCQHALTKTQYRARKAEIPQLWSAFAGLVSREFGPFEVFRLLNLHRLI